MNNDQLTEQEIGNLIDSAQALYRQKIRPWAYPKYKGRMLVIDLESHDYEIDDHDIVATQRLWHRRPGCLTFGIRIGYKAAYHFSAHWTPEDEC